MSNDGIDPPTRLTESASGERRDRYGTATLVAEDRDHALVRRFTLLVTAGPDGGEKFVSSGAEMVIGTHPLCDVVLHDPAISRFHCEIGVAGRAIVVRDLGSSNGTVVDGQPIEEGYLRGGAILGLGRSQLRFDAGGEPVRIPLATEDRFGGLTGNSASLRRVFAQLARAAASDASLLFTGEDGSGKQVAARAVHDASARQSGSFVVVDCARHDVAALEAEIVSALAEARGGTLVLREVGDLPFDLQARIAGALDGAEARLLATSRRDLKLEVNARRFRPELYQRLAALECRLPISRESPPNSASPLEALRAASATAFERETLTRALRAHPRDSAAAAQAAGLDPIRFAFLVERHGIR